jgi:surface antigen
MIRKGRIILNKKSVITGIVLSASTLGVLKVANVAQEFQQVPSVAAESARAKTTPAPSKTTTASVDAVTQPSSEKISVASTEEPVVTAEAITYQGAPVLQDALVKRVAEHAVLPASDSVEETVASLSENVTEETSQERVEKPVDESTVRDSASMSDTISEQARVQEDSQAIASERAVAEPIKEETPTVQAEEVAPVEPKTDVQEESVEKQVSEDLAPITESQVETVASIEEPKAELVVETLTSEPVVEPQAQAQTEVAEASAVQHVNYEGTDNTYPYGQCTWGVKAVAPWAGTQWGNGADWARSAARDGFRTGSNPEVGAIASWDDGGYGHVAYVTHVDPATGYVKVVEANYAGDQSLGDHRGWFNPSDGSWGAVTYIYNN